MTPTSTYTTHFHFSLRKISSNCLYIAIYTTIYPSLSISPRYTKNAYDTYIHTNEKDRPKRTIIMNNTTYHIVIISYLILSFGTQNLCATVSRDTIMMAITVIFSKIRGQTVRDSSEKVCCYS